MASISCLHQFPSLLENEWRKRVAIATFREVTKSLPDAGQYDRLYEKWEAVRPYRRDAEATGYDYPTYRQRKFNAVIKDALHDSAKVFWTTQENSHEFRVSWQRDEITRCAIDAGICEFRIP